MTFNKANYDIDLNLPTENYLKEIIINILPTGPKLIMKALSKVATMNKDSLSLSAQVRRGELNYALGYLEALGFVGTIPHGKSVLCTLTPLGRKIYDKYTEDFEISEEE
ncbi:hypothetical protein [Paenibacillus peoriae]|uniref:hypothetical protein n=1 Tax=Paenibacillus peoriae TaxID=59893 RepID=UPI00215B5F2B|nr:hypothetical protein [Paenibacillus peoriae]